MYFKCLCFTVSLLIVGTLSGNQRKVEGQVGNNLTTDVWSSVVRYGPGRHDQSYTLSSFQHVSFSIITVQPSQNQVLLNPPFFKGHLHFCASISYLFFSPSNDFALYINMIAVASVL